MRLFLRCTRLCVCFAQVPHSGPRGSQRVQYGCQAELFVCCCSVIGCCLSRPSWRSLPLLRRRTRVSAGNQTWIWTLICNQQSTKYAFSLLMSRHDTLFWSCHVFGYVMSKDCIFLFNSFESSVDLDSSLGRYHIDLIHLSSVVERIFCPEDHISSCVWSIHLVPKRFASHLWVDRSGEDADKFSTHKQTGVFRAFIVNNFDCSLEACSRLGSNRRRGWKIHWPETERLSREILGLLFLPSWFVSVTSGSCLRAKTLKMVTHQLRIETRKRVERDRERVWFLTTSCFMLNYSGAAIDVGGCCRVRCVSVCSCQCTSTSPFCWHVRTGGHVSFAARSCAPPRLSPSVTELRNSVPSTPRSSLVPLTPSSRIWLGKLSPFVLQDST